MMCTDKGLTELTSKGFESADRGFVEIKEYVDSRFQEANRRFESLESEIKELRKEISEIKTIHAAIESRLDKIGKRDKGTKGVNEANVSTDKIVSVLASKTKTI